MRFVLLYLLEHPMGWHGPVGSRLGHPELTWSLPGASLQKVPSRASLPVPAHWIARIPTLNRHMIWTN